MSTWSGITASASSLPVPVDVLHAVVEHANGPFIAFGEMNIGLIRHEWRTLLEPAVALYDRATLAA